MTSQKSQLSTYLFGILSVYVIYALLYERLVMLPFQNNKTGQFQYQEYAGTIVFFQIVFAWICVQVFAYFKLSQQQTNNQLKKIPWQKSCIFGVFKFLTLILFTEGLYTTNFRFAFSVRSGSFAASSILGTLYSMLGGALIKKTKLMDIFLGLFILGGTILFWVYDPQICYYVPIQPRVIGTVMMIVSVVLEGVLSIVQFLYIHTENVSPLRMQRDISAWVMVFAYLYTALTWQFPYAIEYSFKHLEYFLEVAILGFLYFLAQLFIYRATKKLQQNTPTYLMSAAMVLMVQVSFSFTVHKYHKFQIVGLVLAWLGIGCSFIMWGQKDETNQKGYHKTAIPYDQIECLQNQENDV